MATKNSYDKNDKQQLITDMDIDSIKVSSLSPEDMYSAEIAADERSHFLLKRHAPLNMESGMLEFDMSRVFELNYAHDLATAQKKTLAFLDDDDPLDEVLFKHHEMLRRVEHNFARFNEQLAVEIRTEEEYEHAMMSTTALQNTQGQLEQLYENAYMLS